MVYPPTGLTAIEREVNTLGRYPMPLVGCGTLYCYLSLWCVVSILWCNDKLICSRSDVHLLRSVSPWTSHAEVPLVEEIFDPHPVGVCSVS